MKERLKNRLSIIIFGTDTKAGKRFDIVLLWIIVASVLTVILESVPEYRMTYKELFVLLEWTFTILFAFEYCIRIWISNRSVKYVTSLWGVIDLLSFAPTFIGIFLAGAHYLIIIRLLRLLRIFRILKLSRFVYESVLLLDAMRNSMRKILVFLLFVLLIVTIMGTTMYVIEGEKHGFAGIPDGIYWAIVTITTVGYGDITPQTVVGKVISSISMLIGYAIIAIPTGIVTVEIGKSNKSKNEVCSVCESKIDRQDKFCRECGNALT